MTKKRFVAILLCVTLVALAAIGATFAYLTDSKTVDNTFTMGNVKITLDETNVNDPEGARVTSNAYNVYPGAVVTKDPIVHNTGKNAAYIRWSVVGVEAGDTFTIGQFDAKFILKYDGALASGADTTAMFQTVTIPAGIDNASADAGSFSSVKVVAQAIQADGFDTWEAAFAAYDAK